MKVLENIINYRNLISISATLNVPLAPPLLGSLRINDGCNSRCNYCWIWKHPIQNITLDNARCAISELKRLGLQMIGLTGGEPLYHPEIDQIIGLVKSSGMACSLNTNGLLLNEDTIKRITDAGLDGLILSIDTLQPDVYQKHRGVPITSVLHGLDRILEYRNRHPNLNVSVNSVVTSCNAAELPAITEYFAERNIAIGFQPLHATFAADDKLTNDFQWSEEDLLVLQQSIDHLLRLKEDGYQINNEAGYLQAFPAILRGKEIPEEFACLAGFTSIAVDHMLLVRSCWPMPPIGDLHYDDLQKLWKSKKYSERRRKMVKLDCPKCWLRCHVEFDSREEFLKLFT